jgi:hypothetical protein
VEELLTVLSLESSTPVVLAEIFEDNAAAYHLANNQQLSPRSRHLNIKWHYFWGEVNNGRLAVSKCSTEDQQADCMTKGLVQVPFERNRRANQGW